MTPRPSLSTRIRTLALTWKPRHLTCRIRHELKARLGAYSAAPRTSPAQPLATYPDSLRAIELPSAPEGPTARQDIEEALESLYRPFHRRSTPAIPVPTGPEWHRHPLTGQRYDATQPWRSIRTLVPGVDIKHAWEPARFTWLIPLRYAAKSDQARATEVFSRHVQDFHASNPAFRGPHWVCAQEVGMRCLAMILAEGAMHEISPACKAALAELYTHSEERIRQSLDYAISQNNNHSISEATALIFLTIRLASEPTAARARLRPLARQLSRLIEEQFATDGHYVQHSTNYHRLALSLCALAAQALSAHDVNLRPQARARLLSATRLLEHLTDPITGTAPNYGANDGSLLIPIPGRDYTDHRPTLDLARRSLNDPQAASATTGRSADAPRYLTGASGWISLRRGRIHVYLRAGKYRSRPSHLDPLHLSVSIDGSPLIVDPGTYSYNSPAPWNNGLASSRVHNGPVTNDAEHAMRGPRFLWYSTPDALITRFTPGEYEDVIEARVPGSAQRKITVRDDSILVEDHPLSPSCESLETTWTLAHQTRARASLFTAPPPNPAFPQRDKTIAWHSTHYGALSPGLALRCRRDGDGLPQPIITRLLLHP